MAAAAMKDMKVTRATVAKMRGASLSAALLCCGTVACVVRTDWPRHQVNVMLAPQSISSPGMHAHEHLWVTFDAVELVPCEQREPMFALLGTAHAHGPTTPIRQGTPYVVDLLAPSPIELAAFTPPPGDYCALSISMGPADDDASGLSRDNLGVIAHSVMWTSTDHDMPMAATTARHDRTFEFSRPWSFGTDQDELDTLTIEVLVDGVIAASTSSQDTAMRGRDVLAAMPASLLMDDPS